MTLSDSVTRGTENAFWGKVPWSLSLESWRLRWFIFITNTQVSQRFSLVTDAIFWAEMWGRVGRTGRGLHTWHAPSPCLRIIRSQQDSSPIMRPWYYLQRRISTGAKFLPSLHLKLSHRAGCGELAQDPRMQTAVWKRLILAKHKSYQNGKPWAKILRNWVLWSDLSPFKSPWYLEVWKPQPQTSLQTMTCLISYSNCCTEKKLRAACHTTSMWTPAESESMFARRSPVFSFLAIWMIFSANSEIHFSDILSEHFGCITATKSWVIKGQEPPQKLQFFK